MTILRARVLTPAGPDQVRWIPDALLELHQGRIVRVEPWQDGPCDEDLRPWVLTPGFVDAHLHFPQTRIVGAASGPLLDWLATSTFPEEARFEEAAHAASVADRFCERLLSSGTTLAMVYGSVHAEAADLLFSALDRHRLRAIAGPVLMDRNCPPELVRAPGPALEALRALEARWRGNDRLQVAVIPRFALSCSVEMLQGAGDLARELDLWSTTHLSENLEECRVAREMFAAPDYLSIYEDAGLLNPKSVYAHCIHLSDDEWSRFAAAGAIVAHCPDSNDFLGSGGMPIGTVRERGIPVAIGSDIAAGRSFRIPRILSSAYDNGLRQGTTLSPAWLLWLGTKGSAEALGYTDLGSLEAGGRADLVAIDVPPWVETADEALGWVLFDHDSRVQRTWIDGEAVWHAS